MNLAPNLIAMSVPANLFWEDGFLLRKINLKKMKKENLKVKHIQGLQHRLHRYTFQPRNIIGMDEQRRFNFFFDEAESGL